jgi:hypothetical protein
LLFILATSLRRLDHLKNHDDNHNDNHDHCIDINTTNTSTNPQATQHVETVMTATTAAAAGARDAICLEPLLCFFFLFPLFISLTFILVNLLQMEKDDRLG